MSGMRKQNARLALPGMLLLGLTVAAGAPLADDGNWPGFRGRGARGVADGHVLPTHWNVAAPVNVRWKTAIPGLGHSAPAVWGGRVFVTTAISGKKDPKLKVGLYGDISSVKDKTTHRYRVYALSKKDGSILWSRTAHEGVPQVERHMKASHANCTPATDGKHVVALFGSEGLYVYSVEGELLWKKNLGRLDSGFYTVPGSQWGFASSPVIHDGKIIVQVDVSKDSFVAAYDIRDGKQLWRTPRDDVPTWSTPTVHVDDSRAQVIVNGYRHIGGYDLRDGKPLWNMRGTGDIPTPTPYVAGGLIFITQAHGGGMPLYAIKTSATGDISLENGTTANEHVAWSEPRGGSYMPTSVAYDGLVYILRDNGVLRCRDLPTGKLLYEERVGSGDGGFTASLVAGDGKIYLTSETGEVHVVKAGPAYELLATNEMDETCMATPAISEGLLLLRTRGHVVALAEHAARAD
jgi:outer membrane protein assembly factor BamB